ncbi:hypothetical protein COO60DRAFT_1119877 [Scenedesmus sp. NREL 46B-D3]|nr:hypothetical protein COO60DRAFT_1119877 [Scenedesmus sp. NREL 46B-D3]
MHARIFAHATLSWCTSLIIAQGCVHPVWCSCNRVHPVWHNATWTVNSFRGVFVGRNRITPCCNCHPVFALHCSTKLAVLHRLRVRLPLVQGCFFVVTDDTRGSCAFNGCDLFERGVQAYVTVTQYVQIRLCMGTTSIPGCWCCMHLLLCVGQSPVIMPGTPYY